MKSSISHHVAQRDELDELGHAEAEAGQRDRADDDAGRRRGDADADHAARAVVEALHTSSRPLVHARRVRVPRKNSMSGRCVTMSTSSMTSPRTRRATATSPRPSGTRSACRTAAGNAVPPCTVGHVSSGRGCRRRCPAAGPGTSPPPRPRPVERRARSPEHPGRGVAEQAASPPRAPSRRRTARRSCRRCRARSAISARRPRARLPADERLHAELQRLEVHDVEERRCTKASRAGTRA